MQTFLIFDLNDMILFSFRLERLYLLQQKEIHLVSRELNSAQDDHIGMQ